MKKQLILLALTSLGSACQPQAPPTQAAATPVAITTPATSKVAPPVPAPVTDSLTPAMRATLRQVNVAKLFLAPAAPQAEGYKTALDGFFGGNPQRLSLAILTARRDSLRPELLHVTGKTRYRKQVTAFKGDICLTRLSDFYDQGLLLSQGDGFIQDTTSEAMHIINARAYAATAAFRFSGIQPAAYVLTGRALLDFWIMDNGTVGTLLTPYQGDVLEEAAAKGGGILLKGNWQDMPGKAAKAFAVSPNIFMVSPTLIKDFGIGDRSSQINPKYAKLGWASYWENDEWWATSPRPSLSL